MEWQRLRTPSGTSTTSMSGRWVRQRFFVVSAASPVAVVDIAAAAEDDEDDAFASDVSYEKFWIYYCSDLMLPHLQTTTSSQVRMTTILPPPRW